MNKRIFLPCCLLLLACTLPQSSYAPPHLPIGSVAEWFGRLLRKELTKLEESAAKQKAAKASQETLRANEKAIAELHRIPENATTEDLATHWWAAADQEIQQRVRAEVAELESRLDKEARQIAEDEELTEKCKASLTSVLKQTACFGLKTRIEMDQWPDEQKLSDFVTNHLEKAAMGCVTRRLARRVPKTNFSGIVEPTLKKVGEFLVDTVAPAPGSHPEPKDEMRKAELYLLGCFCQGE